MAEAGGQSRLLDRWIAFSAGTKPVGYVHPYALVALEETGIFHQGESKSVDVFKGQSFDLVVTLCDQAREIAPFGLGQRSESMLVLKTQRAVSRHRRNEKMAAFRKTLKLIRATIPAVLKEFED